MDDKKRKKFGLSLKNAKKIAVAKSEVKKTCSILVRNAPSSTISKEIKDVINTNKKISPQERDFSKNIKPSLKNCFGTQNVDNDDEVRTLWKNLFSEKTSKSSVNWETMEDLPISNVTHTSLMADKVSSSISSENATIFECKTIQEMEALNVQFNYKDLPKLRIPRYTRKSYPLEWSCDEKGHQDGNSLVKENMNNITHDQAKSSIGINMNNNNNINSKKHPCSTNLLQSSNESHKSDSLKSSWNNRKPAFIYSSEKVECKKFIHNKYPNNTKMIKSISECPAFEEKSKSFKGNSTLDLKTTNTLKPVIDLTNDDWEQMPSSNKKERFADISINNTPFRKRQTINKQNVNSIMRPDYADSGIASFTDELQRKRKDKPMKKEILNCCPMCQLYFPIEMRTQGIDQHISNCIGNEEVFIDDEDDDW